MKINEITSVDYYTTDGNLTIIFAGTTLETIIGMDPTLVTVRTDAGDLVETYAGYALQSVTYNVEAGYYQAVFIPTVRDGTADTIRQLAAQVDALTKKLEEMQPTQPTVTPVQPTPQTTIVAQESETADPTPQETDDTTAPVTESTAKTRQEA